jgi:hypothetical protein
MKQNWEGINKKLEQSLLVQGDQETKRIASGGDLYR